MSCHICIFFKENERLVSACNGMSYSLKKWVFSQKDASWKTENSPLAETQETFHFELLYRAPECKHLSVKDTNVECSTLLRNHLITTTSLLGQVCVCCLKGRSTRSHVAKQTTTDRMLPLGTHKVYMWPECHTAEDSWLSQWFPVVYFLRIFLHQHLLNETVERISLYFVDS